MAELSFKKRIILVAIVLIVVFTIVFRHKIFGNGYTQEITDDDATVLPNSIAVLESISLGGMDQWILMRGHNTDNPVLLWLHGGPGSSQMPIAHAIDTELERAFIMVHWDQRGAGKSNPSDFDEQTMTYEQFISDTHQLTAYLKERFGKEKIYLLGHSWGTQIGLEVVSRYHDDYHGYIGVSQVVNRELSESIAHRWLHLQIQKHANEKGRKKLSELGPPPYVEHDRFLTFIKLVDAYGGSFDSSFFDLLRISCAASEYTFWDMLAWLRGANRGSGPMWSEKAYNEFDAMERFSTLQVPVYLFQGRGDYNTPLDATRKYYDHLESPNGKQLVIFEHSAHTPFLAEPQKFTHELIRMKQETYNP